MISKLFEGERIRLTALRADDAQTFSQWYQDGEFARLFDANPAVPKSERDIEKYVDDAFRDRSRHAFAIRQHFSDELVGVLELDSIQWSHGSAWLAIGIGDPAYRNKGYATEAMTLLLKFAFHELNLHRLQLTVFSYNEPAIRLYENLGFKREGVFREALHRDGQRFDMLLYGLLKPEWEAASGATGATSVPPAP
ncbi:MAG: GNAT family N-acetyltransferase [Chloroflexi bacterium]|nr:GNAT family N-acetyltransferase [Chloroflexota bacterium]